MVLKKVNRTAITCWSPATEVEPYLALGTVAGALDASFSSKTELEIFSLNLADSGKSMEKVTGIPGNARYLNYLFLVSPTNTLLDLIAFHGARKY